MTRLVRVANTGLKVVVFSVSCGESARVAGKGLSEGELRVDSSKLKGIARELNTETPSAQRSEEERTGTYFLSPPATKNDMSITYSY